MQIVAIMTIQGSKTVYSPGTLFEADDKEARRLIKLGAARRPSKVDIGEEEIDTYTEEEVSEIENNLCQIDEIDEELAAKLFEEGIQSLEELAVADVKQLTKIKGIGKVTAKKIIESAQALI